MVLLYKFFIVCAKLFTNGGSRYFMSIFDIFTLLGGLAMFLYGMRLMSSGLKESSSGTLKKVMEKVTNNLFMSFLLGVCVTAIIQSSTATIVITSGLVAAGVISLRQSLGIIIGANVGTTVTGQIIRLLDVDSSSTAWLEFFKPSTLAPVALIIGIILIMFLKFKKSDTIGTIAMGFGILFTGLLNMTGSVNALSSTGIFDRIFSKIGESPIIGYISGAGVAFALQSSSATIGILQAFSVTGQLSFKGIYAVLVGIYLGDCVTTAIVCSIGAKADAKRVGIVNILFNLSETVLVLAVVTVLHRLGLLTELWNRPLSSGGIANTNTVFNLGCAILLFPMVPLYEKASRRIIKDDSTGPVLFSDKMEALNPNFFATPALAFNACYDALITMFDAARENFLTAFDMLGAYDPIKAQEINEKEKGIDRLTDSISNYLIHFSPYVKAEEHTRIMNQYFRVITEFERLGDHAVNICEEAEELSEKELSFSPVCVKELAVLKELMIKILDYSRQAFVKRDFEAAGHIEPLEEVADDMVSALRDNHLARLSNGDCSPLLDPVFQNLMTDVERISDICSNVGVSVVTRIKPELANQAHSYISFLHQGHDANYNRNYSENHNYFFGLLEKLE